MFSNNKHCITSLEAGQVATVDANNCAAGWFCDGKTPVSTKKGGKRCSLGKYCPAGTTLELNCPVGKLGYMEGLKLPQDCEDCPAGMGEYIRGSALIWGIGPLFENWCIFGGVLH